MSPCKVCGSESAVCGHGNRKVELEIEVVLAQWDAERRARERRWRIDNDMEWVRARKRPERATEADSAGLTDSTDPAQKTGTNDKGK